MRNGNGNGNGSNGSQDMTATMQTLNFGVEIETFGIRRETAARAIATALGTGRIAHLGGYYDKWAAIDEQGRRWVVMTDSSIRAASAYQCELVTPILNWADIETLQNVVRALRRAGAQVDSSTGMHIHVDGAEFTTRSLRALVANWSRWEDCILHAAEHLNPNGRNIQQWAAKVDEGFKARMHGSKASAGLGKVADNWYGTDRWSSERPYNPEQRGGGRSNGLSHYNGTRYRALNLHALWWIGTVEFRCWNATLHAGKVRAALVFCLAMAAKALNARSARFQPTLPADAECSGGWFSMFLSADLKLRGEEFRNVTRHLLAGWERRPYGPMPS